MVQRIELDGAVNARDLGGLPTSDGGHIAPGRLLRADNLQDLSERDVKKLVEEFGLTTVIDLRSVEEITAEGPGPLRAQAGVEHVHRSVALVEAGSGEEVAREVLLARRERFATADPHAETAGHYLGYLEDRPESVVSALRDIAEAPGASLVHCAAGKDRTGVVVALALLVAGVSRDDVVDDYVATGTVIEQIMARLRVRPVYGKGIDDITLDQHTPKGPAMVAFLDLIDTRFGGLPAWLAAQGFTDADVTALRAKLLDQRSSSSS